MNVLNQEHKELEDFSEEISCNQLYLYILRFYFIFFPMYPMISKFIGTSLWKDGLYIFLTLVGFNVLIKNKFFVAYFASLFLIILFQVTQGYDYMEFLTWFFMGPPIYLYFRYISYDEFKNDLRFLMLIMTFGFLFVFFYEIPTKDSMFFEIDGEKGTGGMYLRDDSIRARFGFVSPMALSQYSWFIAVTLFITNTFSKTVRYLFIALMGALIIYCNSRAGLFLGAVTVVIFIYTRFKFYKLKIFNFLSVLVIGAAVIFKNVLSGSASNHNNETLSDELRIFYLLDGITKAKEHFIMGISGYYYSPRAENWYDFENSWLSLIVCFGVIGIFLIFLLYKKILFTTTDKRLLLYIIPWMAYSSLFPILQEMTAVFITWVILGAVLNYDNWLEINDVDPDETDNEEEGEMMTENEKLLTTQIK